MKGSNTKLSTACRQKLCGGASFRSQGVYYLWWRLQKRAWRSSWRFHTKTN